MSSAIGWSATIKAALAAGTPPPGDVNIYLDVTGGNNANTGASWAQAFLTWARAAQAMEQVLAMNPATADIVIHVTNTTGAAIAAGSFSLSPALPDRTRLHVVCDFDRWTVVAGQTGLVGAAGITAEPGSGLANVVMAAPFVVAANDVGKTLRLTRPVGDPGGNENEILPMTILALGAIANSYVCSTLNAVIPAFWGADALTIGNVIEPPNVLNGTLTFAPTCGPVFNTALFDPKNWLVGVRANNIVFAGEDTAAALCDARAPAAVVSDGQIVNGSAGGAMLEWVYELTGGLVSYMTVAHAQAWGLVGLTPVAGFASGNACLLLDSRGGPSSRFAGYVIGSLTVSRNGYLLAERFRADRLLCQTGAQVLARFFQVRGDAQSSPIEAQDDGTDVTVSEFALEEEALGQLCVALSGDDARLVVSGTAVCVQTVIAANFPIDGFIADGGRLEFTGGIVDALSITINGRLIFADNMGEVECDAAINMVTARPAVAVAPDILVTNGSKMVLRGNLVKTIENTIPSHCVDIDFGSKFIQASGVFDIGAAPADWTNAYLLGGLIHVDHGSVATFGTIDDDAGGVGGGVAITARHGSQIWWAANGTITGAATVVVGVKAPAAFPAAAVLNDLPAGAGGVAGTEELCVVGVL